MEFEPADVVYLSYGCQFSECGVLHTRGFIDPESARQHMAEAHRIDAEPLIIRWPRYVRWFEGGPVDAYS